MAFRDAISVVLTREGDGSSVHCHTELDPRGQAGGSGLALRTGPNRRFLNLSPQL